MGQLTPMMVQYRKTKESYKDCILFYRLGDFYEMFFEDAKIASKELELVLTGKDCGLEERAPMCGIPYHAYESYLNKLVSRGYKVAICEQVEDPKLAKGLVKREVIRIVTPGTNLNAQALDETKNQYLMCIYDAENGARYGLAFCDVSTGEFLTTEVGDEKQIMDELVKFMPAELLCTEAFLISGFDCEDLKERLHIAVSVLDSHYFDETMCRKLLEEHYHVQNLNGFGLEGLGASVQASGALLKYLEETQKTSLAHLTSLSVYSIKKTMVIDAATRRNLELTETLREKRKAGSLLWVLDKTKTAMGARTLRGFIEQPLRNMQAITARQMAVSALKREAIDREELREYLGPIYDLERLIGRISYESAHARDLIALRNSLEMLTPIRTILASFDAPLLKQLYEQIDPLEDLHAWISETIDEDAPLTVKDGGIIKQGYSPEVDRLRTAKTEGKDWLARLEASEREKTGIKNLRVRYNKVFGYYIEVSNSYKDQVPEHYVRKQTLTNAERFIIPELKELEDTILGAQDRLNALEYAIFAQLRSRIAAEVQRVQSTARAIAMLDALCSLAHVAEKNRYVCPVMNETGRIRIKNGRHPVVEKMLRDEPFIPNDICLDQTDHRMAIITGPNMAGKSTFMRQTALMVLMAHIGSFVPAEAAEISIVDRIFTRVGASDDLASGQSTFMVEMTEVANIVRNATAQSLIILDEIGRGTSTYDGLSIAWAVAEYISDPKKIGAKTLFATHYHELTQLEGMLDGVQNYCVAVKEDGDRILFLRKIIRGGADRSYGIQVAALAGVPDQITERAFEIVQGLAQTDTMERVQEMLHREVKASAVKKRKQDEVDLAQLSLFELQPDDEKDAVLDEITRLDLTRMTPLEALSVLDRFQRSLKNRVD